MWIDGKTQIVRTLEEALDKGWKEGVGPGWHPLLYTFAKNVDYLVSKGEMPEVTFSQIKEKFGGLRLYYNGGNDLTMRISAIVEDLSYEMCETCGRKPLKNVKAKWIRTQCADHYN